MKAVILAAGLGTRLGSLSKSIPKCLLEINGKSMLENQIKLLNKVGIEDIYVVIGGKGECWTEENKAKIREISKKVVVNLDNEDTKNTYSLSLALEKISDDDVLVIDGDLALSSSLLNNVVEGKGNFLLVKESAEENDPNNKVVINGEGKILEISRELGNVGKSHLTYGCMIKIGQEDFEKFKSRVRDKKYYSLDLGFVVNDLCKEMDLFHFKNDKWINVNTMEELEAAGKFVERNFVAITFGYTGTGKSTLAKKISKLSNTEIFHSAIVRKELNLSPKTKEEANLFFDYRNNLRGEVDKKVYAKLAENAATSLREGKNVVLDAAFFFLWQRSLIYEKVREFEPDFFVIKAICEDEKEMKKRFEERGKKFGESPFNETPSWDTYLVTKNITESLEGDVKGGIDFLNVFEYDTLSKKLKIIQDVGKSENFEKIWRAMS